jgi:hypothetical protein
MDEKIAGFTNSHLSFLIPLWQRGIKGDFKDMFDYFIP